MEKFKKELESLINRHSIENIVDMPDFMLADLICNFINILPTKMLLDWHGCDSVCHPANSSLERIDKMENNNNVIVECIQIAKDEWNSGADVHNQWHHISFEEKVELVMDEVYKEIRNELQNFGLEKFGE